MTSKELATDLDKAADAIAALRYSSPGNGWPAEVEQQLREIEREIRILVVDLRLP